MAVRDTLEFLFSEPVDKNTINSNTIQVLLGTQRINGLVSYDELTRKAYFSPDAWGQDGCFVVSRIMSTGKSYPAERLSGDVITYANITIDAGGGGQLHEVAQSTGARGDGGNGILA